MWKVTVMSLVFDKSVNLVSDCGPEAEDTFYQLCEITTSNQT